MDLQPIHGGPAGLAGAEMNRGCLLALLLLPPPQRGGLAGVPGGGGSVPDVMMSYRNDIIALGTQGHCWQARRPTGMHPQAAIF